MQNVRTLEGKKKFPRYLVEKRRNKNGILHRCCKISTQRFKFL